VSALIVLAYRLRVYLRVLIGVCSGNIEAEILDLQIIIDAVL
jgi:hypothetical protein